MAEHVALKKRMGNSDWRERYGKVNQHHGWIPRDFWLEEWERQAIVGFHLKKPLEGYRRPAFMMLDADIVMELVAGTPVKGHCPTEAVGYKLANGWESQMRGFAYPKW